MTLLELAKEKGFTRTELSKASNIRLTSLDRYIYRDKSIKSINALYALNLAAALKITVEELLHLVD